MSKSLLLMLLTPPLVLYLKLRLFSLNPKKDLHCVRETYLWSFHTLSEPRHPVRGLERKKKDPTDKRDVLLGSFARRANCFFFLEFLLASGYCLK